METKPIELADGAAAPAQHWAPEFSWIDSTLAVGGSFPHGVAARLARECRITAVIDVRIEDSDHPEELASSGLAFLRLPTEDACGVSQKMLDEGVRFARKAAGGRLLVHCQHGIGRSAIVALCVLVDRGYAPMEALRRAKDAREKISPARCQFEAWAEWIGTRAPQHRAPGFDDFAEVAYRHLRGQA
jgi:hypothetical protein